MRGQISIDLIFSIMLLLLVSIFLSYSIFSFSDTQLVSYVGDRVESMMDNIENFMLVSYAKDLDISYKLKPIGDNYTIIIKNRALTVVNSPIHILIVPNNDGVNIIMPNSTLVNDIGNKIKIIVNINGKAYNFTKTLKVNIVNVTS